MASRSWSSYHTQNKPGIISICFTASIKTQYLNVLFIHEAADGVVTLGQCLHILWNPDQIFNIRGCSLTINITFQLFYLIFGFYSQWFKLQYHRLAHTREQLTRGSD